MGDKHPRRCAGNGCFKIFCQSTASSEPCERPLDHPPTRQNFEPADVIGSFDDFYRPLSNSFERSPQFVTGIAAVGEDMPQPGIERTDRGQRDRAAIAVLNVGGMHDEPNEMTKCIGHDVPLASLDLLARIKATRPSVKRVWR